VLAKGLAARGHEVHVLSFDAPAARPFFPLPPGVRLQALDLNRAARNPLHGLALNFRRLCVLRRALRALEPTVAVGFMDATNVLCILAGRSLGIPVVASEHTDPEACDIGRMWSALRRLTYPLAYRVVAQTGRVCRMLPGRCMVAPNPLDVSAGGEAPARAETGGQAGCRLAAMGRLAPEKGFDLLLHAASLLAQTRQDWTLTVIGEGPERPCLEALRRQLRLEERVHFPGALAAPEQWLRAADIFVLPSRYEGFANALAEALACGVPAVAFDCPSGPAEIIRPEVDGLLVPPGDVAALAAAVARLMGDEPLRRAMAARAPEVLHRFGLEKVLDLWEALFNDARRARSSARGNRS